MAKQGEAEETPKHLLQSEEDGTIIGVQEKSGAFDELIRETRLGWFPCHVAFLIMDRYCKSICNLTMTLEAGVAFP